MLHFEIIAGLEYMYRVQSYHCSSFIGMADPILFATNEVPPPQHGGALWCTLTYLLVHYCLFVLIDDVISMLTFNVLSLT